MMYSRRKFLQMSALSGASFWMLPGLIQAAPAGKKLEKFGFISGIIGKELLSDWKAALKQSVQYGFTEIETGKYLGESAPEFMAFCKSIGLTPVVGGVPFTSDRSELNKNLDNLAELGIRYAVVYWPWTGSGPFMLEDCKKSADTMNKMGAICNERGMAFTWHNHNKEFVTMEKGMPFDFLMENTDKSLVSCEMDIYWVAKGGADPLQVLKKYSGRIPILHVKDMAPGEAMDFACPGSGIIDFPAVFREADKQGIEHYFVERDNVPDGLECLRTSGEYLRNIRF
jgi:sugar phosphate isomerase/epimerase